MTGFIIRILIFAVVFGIIYLGIRKIWRDWKGQFKSEDEAARQLRRERDLRERQQPGVIDLKRDNDGTFRPNGKDDDKRR
ncbi:hypothetical protein FF80_02277 [Devosia sp. LC5]|uniref:hypothetical protein n=1 Tax=Devosia sp. LC5 TaxID=1502724 RepID=UPI0004E3DBAB|nr:hypothetical protein [Devosia sp. LC5]KFC67356.1 hypothetical protein FF80_02277 [Devosia sp. LC5]